MEHFVTLFDQVFLPQGLALHRSLRRVMPESVLWVLCIDQETKSVLDELTLDELHTLSLPNLEDPALLAAKRGRNAREYCWTLTPFAPRFVFEAGASVTRVTYVDAGLWFHKPPRALFRELEEARKAVLITDHGYAPEYDQSLKSGQYCVQFMTFTRAGEPVRADWQAKCLAWCRVVPEHGKFGDQKHLDRWPENFYDLVRVLRDKDLTLAHWNAARFPYGNSVFFHVHGLRIVDDMTLHLTYYPTPNAVLREVYGPYLEDLRAAAAMLRGLGRQIAPQKTIASPSLLTRLRLKGRRRAVRPNLL